MQVGERRASDNRHYQLSLAGITLFVGLVAVVFALMQPFDPCVDLEIVRNEDNSAFIRLDDRSLIGRMVYARPDLTPVVALEDAAGFQQEQNSTTADWREIPVDGITFESPVLQDLEFPVALSIYVKSRLTSGQAVVAVDIERVKSKEDKSNGSGLFDE